MMRASRGILTLAVVAAVLCADRTLTLAAEVRPQMMETARQVVRHLGERYRHRTPAARCMGPSRILSPRHPTPARAEAANLPSNPIGSLAQLPMPPPRA